MNKRTTELNDSDIQKIKDLLNQLVKKPDEELPDFERFALTLGPIVVMAHEYRKFLANEAQ